MSQEKRKYDATVARIAGNIASGCFAHRATDIRKTLEDPANDLEIARVCVAVARAIVAEVERTEPSASSKDHP